jgi:hypothetical protein
LGKVTPFVKTGAFGIENRKVEENHEAGVLNQ